MKVTKGRRGTEPMDKLRERCNWYFGGFDGGHRCQKEKGHETEGIGHSWDLSLEATLRQQTPHGRFLILVDPQPTKIESSGRWHWPLPEKAQFPGCCTAVVTASREWWEYAPTEAKPHPSATALWHEDQWYWVVPGGQQTPAVGESRGPNVADHNYQTNGHSRDPECKICHGKWDYEEHPDVIKEERRYVQPVKCPCGNHPVFVRESGAIVEHLDAQGEPCVANGKKFADFAASQPDTPPTSQIECFTCEGESGQPATHMVAICEQCFGEEGQPAAPPTPREGLSDYEKLWEEWRLKRFPAREEEWSHHWKAVAIEFAVEAAGRAAGQTSGDALREMAQNSLVLQGRMNEHANALHDYFAHARESTELFDFVEYHRKRIDELRQGAALGQTSTQHELLLAKIEGAIEEHIRHCAGCKKGNQCSRMDWLKRERKRVERNVEPRMLSNPWAGQTSTTPGDVQSALIEGENSAKGSTSNTLKVTSNTAPGREESKHGS